MLISSNSTTFKELLEAVRSNSYSDKILELSENDINDAQVEALVEALKSNTYIKVVNLGNNKIGDAGAKALASVFLDELDLSCNQIGHEGAKALAGAKIKFLCLSVNPLNSEGVQHFSESLHIREIMLSQCGAGDTGAKAVFKNNYLEVVDLSNNNITDVGMEGIIAASLINLNLSQNRLTNRGAEFIAKLASLRVVNLSTNQLGDAGVIPLVQHTGIESLNLSQNGITAQGFSDICKSSTLQRVELYNNDISFENNCQLPSNTSLVTVGLGRNALDSNCSKILKTLASIPTLEDLVLTGNDIDDKGAKILFQYRSKTLKKIDLTNNPIHDATLVKQALNLQ